MSLAFSKSHLEGKLRDLRHLTEDFGRLIEQAETLRQDTWSYHAHYQQSAAAKNSRTSSLPEKLPKHWLMR
jgi:hypothetical protein